MVVLHVALGGSCLRDLESKNLALGGEVQFAMLMAPLTMLEVNLACNLLGSTWLMVQMRSAAEGEPHVVQAVGWAGLAFAHQRGLTLSAGMDIHFALV
jgi:hypothetical protein